MGIINNTFKTDYWYKIGYPGYGKRDHEKFFVFNALGGHMETIANPDERARGKYLNLLENRYDWMNIEQITNTVLEDIDSIVLKFFNMIQDVDDLAKLISNSKIKIDIQQFFLSVYLIEKGKVDQGIQVAKSICNNKFLKDKIDQYLYDKGIHSYIE
ncbi:hypothetical protein AC231_14755 [Clostridium pasteurianum]|nr:hypothetical protein [Clostridium pasteurianum]OMH21682.1 hypothetical protein AC231_14755 [Clostridium pasteurianum]